MRSEGFHVNEKSTDTSWDRTSDLPICITAPETTVLPRSPFMTGTETNLYGRILERVGGVVEKLVVNIQVQ